MLIAFQLVILLPVKVKLSFFHNENPALYRKKYAEEYRRLNREKLRAYSAEWRRLYRARARAGVKDWKRRNPAKVSAQQARHRARAAAK